MNIQESLDYIHSVHWSFCKPGLDRIAELCRRLGNPQDGLKFIHVAGTNGKGSTCSMLSSVLREAGYRVGLYTSPYIRFFNERMCVDGCPISDDELAELTTEIRPIADAMTDKPTEFELITALAFEYFRRHACDVVVLEAGMGGRLDSTNIIRRPLLSVITGIALDHMAYLGDTTEKIAAEKAGIIKDGAPVLFGGEDDGASDVIAKQAACVGSAYFRVDYGQLKNLRTDLSGSVFDFEQRQDLSIGLLGLYQPKNACLVVRAVDLLNAGGLHVSENALRDGLKKAVWPGRFEIISRNPLMIFDGAHNPQGIQCATASIAHYFGHRKVYLLTGVLRDKDYTAIAADLSSVASRAFTVTPGNPRALSAEEYADTLRRAGIEAEAFGEHLFDALQAARAAAKRDGVPLICLGSLYLYADLMAEMKKIEDDETP